MFPPPGCPLPPLNHPTLGRVALRLSPNLVPRASKTRPSGFPFFAPSTCGAYFLPQGLELEWFCNFGSFCKDGAFSHGSKDCGVKPSVFNGFSPVLIDCLASNLRNNSQFNCVVTVGIGIARLTSAPKD